MNLFEDHSLWIERLAPLIKKHADRPHPLNYENLYQLFIMVILSSQDNDDNINQISRILFKKYPDFLSMANAGYNELTEILSGVTYYEKKIPWILENSKLAASMKYLPTRLSELLKFKGIGRKSAFVLLQEQGLPFNGIIVDLHVLRVAPRIGLTRLTTNADILEKELMKAIPENYWNTIGMVLSHHGRETCRPKPKCHLCPIKKNCNLFIKNCI